MKKIALHAGFSALIFSLSASAASFTVNTTANTADANAGDGICADAVAKCSLRAAVEESNAGSGDDTVTLPAGTYNVSSLMWTSSGTLAGAGSGSTHIVGDGSGRVFLLGTGSGSIVQQIGGVSISGGVSPDNALGGGIAVLGGVSFRLVEAEVADNTAHSDGGGMMCGGDCIIVRSYIHDNDAIPPGNSVFSSGGGIYAGGNSGASVLIVDSTISGNRASTGGGIYATAPTVLVNSTVSGNRAVKYDDNSPPSGQGGGLYVGSGSAVTMGLFNSTVAANTAELDDGTGGGGAFVENGTLLIINSIMAANVSRTTLRDDVSCQATSGTVDSDGYNVIEASRCTFTPSTRDVIGTSESPQNARLAVLASNGGPTPTHALATGSVAINRNPGNCTDNAGNKVSADQRGIARDASCDAGAYEYKTDSSGGSGGDPIVIDGGGALPAIALLPLLLAGLARRFR